VADFPFVIPEAMRAELAASIDAEEKLPRALDRLGGLAGRDVVLLDADRGFRGRQLAAMGARVIALAASSGVGTARRGVEGGSAKIDVRPGTATASGLPDGSADAVVSFWSAFRPAASGASARADAELAEADRILRPDGRLLVVHDYGRDDLSTLLPPERSAELVAWSRRDGWFLANRFRIHVVHAFITFPDVDRLRESIGAVFGAAARGLVADVRRPRLSWKVVVYERLRGGVAPA
jgi:hypothetical protein